MRQISFADWELMRQGDRGVRLEPLLQAISVFLDDQRDVIECIRRDLERGLKKPATGRNGMTASQVLRSLVLMRVKSWDFRELRERIADGYTLRTSPISTATRYPNMTPSTVPLIALLPRRSKPSMN